MDNLSVEKFKSLLEYFVAHLNYVQSGSASIEGFDKYIKPLLDAGLFKKTGQGYKGDAIQNQIKEWEYFHPHRVCINVQGNFGNNYNTKKSYINWIDTGINVFADWDNGKVVSLMIGYYLWWKEGNKFEVFVSKSIQDLGLYQKGITDELRKFFNLFVKEIEDYDNRRGDYYKGYMEYKLMEYKLMEFIKLFENNYNLILTGAPGTGKTHLALEIAKAMGATYQLVQFHPSYDYTDFVEGLRPVQDENGNVGFERRDGVFKEFCKKALNEHKKAKEENKEPLKYVFIIDEINRGEISKIFGELFFSIDPGYRGTKGLVGTQYQNMLSDYDTFKQGFYVPENVYIIGTMNDIDRSVESMDFAFRRRFAFKEIKASDTQDMLSILNDTNLITEATNRMNRLNDEIEKIDGLSSAYHIGASYFLKLENYKNDSDKGFASLWNYHLEGLLREYLRGSEDIEDKIKNLKNVYNGVSN